VDIKFRIAELSDIKNIIDLTNECFDEKNCFKYAENIFKKYKHDKNQIYLIGEIDNKVVAHAKITVIPTIYKSMNTYAILNHVCVKPDLRRKNIGTKMLDEITKICKERNCESIKLWSCNFRVAAHACYNNYGFEVLDAKFFYKDI